MKNRALVLSFVVISMSSSFFSCAWTPEVSHFSKIPIGKQLPIDGVWVNNKGVNYRIQQGRMYVTEQTGLYPTGSVIAADINPGKDPFDLSCRVFSINPNHRTSGFGPGSLQITSCSTIDLLTHPCPRLKLKRFTRETLKKVKIDDPLTIARLFIFTNKISVTRKSAKYRTSLRGKALAMIPSSDQEFFIEVVRKCPDQEIRLQALGKINRSETLLGIAVSNENLELRLAALAKCPEDKLGAIIKNSPDPKIRQKALGRMRGSENLAKVVAMNISPAINRKCIDKISDLNVLVRIASQNPSIDLCRYCLTKISNQNLLAVIAATTGKFAIARDVVNNITNQHLLEAIARKTKLDKVKKMANKKFAIFSDITKLLSLGSEGLEEGHRRHLQTLQLSKTRSNTGSAIRSELISYQRAIKYFKAALKLEPNSALATAKLALASACHARQANTAMMLTNNGFQGVFASIPQGLLLLADKALTLAPPQAPDIHALRGWTYIVAYRARRQEAELTRKEVASPAQLALLKTAVGDLTIAIDAGKGLPRTLGQRALCYYYQKNYVHALADIDAAKKHGGKPQPDLWLVLALNRHRPKK